MKAQHFYFIFLRHLSGVFFRVFKKNVNTFEIHCEAVLSTVRAIAVALEANIRDGMRGITVATLCCPRERPAWWVSTLMQCRDVEKGNHLLISPPLAL